MCAKDSDGMTNKVDPIGLKEPSDLGLYCLHRPVCPKSYDHYGIIFTRFFLRPKQKNRHIYCTENGSVGCNSFLF